MDSESIINAISMAQSKNENQVSNKDISKQVLIIHITIYDIDRCS